MEKIIKLLAHAKDYKRIGVGDTGLNTGGMGCVSPLPFLTDDFMQKIETKIIQPTINGLQNENIIYNGFIFFGLIKVGSEPYIIEYNCRMGDPETEVVIPLLKKDIVDLFLSIYNNTLKNTVIEFDERACATIVAVSKGYPGEYKKNIPITNLANEQMDNNSIIFHAGTKMNGNNVVTNGGRVLAVTSFGTEYY